MLKNRKIVTRISLSAESGEFDGGNGRDVILEDYRATAEITDISWYSGGELSMRIYGVPPEVMNKLSTLGITQSLVPKNTISVLAGEVDDKGQGSLSEVYAGTIKSAHADYSAQPNVSLALEATAGFFEGQKRVPPTTYRGDMKVADSIKVLTEEMGWTFVNDGVDTVLRDVHVEGSAVGQIHALARAAGIACIMSMNTVTISPYNGITTATPVEISPETGLIGYPAFASGGIAANTLFNPAIRAGGKIKLTTSVPQAKGEFNVQFVQHQISCEMPDGPWMTNVYANHNDYYMAGSYD